MTTAVEAVLRNDMGRSFAASGGAVFFDGKEAGRTNSHTYGLRAHNGAAGGKVPAGPRRALGNDGIIVKTR
jgi:hypothetical protein